MPERAVVSVIHALTAASDALATAADLDAMRAALRPALAAFSAPPDALLVQLWQPQRRAAVTGAEANGAAAMAMDEELLERARLLLGDDQRGLRERQAEVLPPPFDSAAAAPIISRGRAIGALLLRARRETAPTEDDLAVLTLLGRQLGAAMTRAGLAARDTHHCEAVLAELSASLLSGQPLDELLDHTVKAALDVGDSDMAAIFLYDDERALSARLHCSDPRLDLDAGLRKAARLPVSLIPHERRMIETRQPQYLGPDSVWMAASEEVARRFPYRLLVPVMSQERVLGALYLYRERPEPFAEDDARAAGEVARRAAFALEQAALLEREHRQRKTLQVVHDLAKRLNRATSQQEIAEIAVQECLLALNAGSASLHVFERQADRLVIAAAVGLPLPFVTATSHLSIGVGIWGLAAERGELVAIDDVEGDPHWEPIRRSVDTALAVRSAWALPLYADSGELLGTLAAYHPAVRRPSTADQSLFQLMAHQIAVALDRALLADRSRELYRATATSLAAAVDAKDPFTHNHSVHVADICRKIAQAMGLSAAEIEIIELAGLLHDVGKIGIPDRVLQKPDKLDADEWAMMRRHPELGAKILGDNPALAGVVPYVRYHHERYDGHGYPERLQGNEIPLGAAIVCLADAFHTMTASRPYCPARTFAEAVAEVERCRATQFHPAVVDAFLRAVRGGEIAPSSVMAASAAGSTTRQLRLKRVVGVEARAFGLLQRISGEVSALVDIERFLGRLDRLMKAEFPESECEVFIREPGAGLLRSVPLDPESSGGLAPTLTRPEGSPIVELAAATGQSQNVADLATQPAEGSSSSALRSELAVPLMVDGRCVGVLDLRHPEPAAFSPVDQHVLEIVATYVAQAIEVADLHNQLKRQADLDPLTGLLNHRAFYRRLDREVELARASGWTTAIALLDADDLKSINDSAGHLAGDDAIRRIARILSSVMTGDEAIARYGGDEFAIIAPRVSRGLLTQRLEVLDRAIAMAAQDAPVPSLSWGVACYPADGLRATELVAHADAAMYAAKLSRPGRRPRAGALPTIVS